MEGAKEEEDEEKEEEESASEEALDRLDLELSLGFTPYGHGRFIGYDTANTLIILSQTKSTISLCSVQFW